MERYFFLYHYHPVRKKVLKKGKETEKTEWVRNADVRERIIGGCKDRKDGYSKFLEMGEKDEKFRKLRDIPCPPEYSWIFRHFMQIWQNAEYDMGGNVIFTYRTVNEYVECMKVPLTVEDKKMLFKMKGWAQGVIAGMKDGEKEK